MDLRDVTVEASGTNGVLGSSGAVTLHDSSLTVRANPGTARAASVIQSSLTIRNSTVHVHSPNDAVGVHAYDAGVRIERSTITVHGGFDATGITAEEGEMSIRESAIQTTGQGAQRALVSLKYNDVDVEGGRIQTSSSAFEPGVALVSSEARSILRVGAAKVAGAIVGSPKCVGAYDGEFEPLGPDCRRP